MKNFLKERLYRYVQIDTQADMENLNCPSTPGQMILARLLVDELKLIGMEDVTIDDYGYVMATLPANVTKAVPVIGFLAHLDTATDMTGKNVKPKLWENYDGNNLLLNEKLNIVLSPDDFPRLRHNYIGHDLITTDGTTLLGADNKAGVAEIMTAMEFLIQNPDIQHGKIRVAFTPDEEIGRGPRKFDVESFGAKYAYTVDGSIEGELQYESFNAASAKITVTGNNVHPGTAKGIMIHSGKIAMELHQMLPPEMAPEFTEGYEGFYHLINMASEVEKTTMYYIIRDFDKARFEEKKEYLLQIISKLNAKYGDELIHIELEDSYYNMAEVIKNEKAIIEVAEEAMKRLDIEPINDPIRGGTDGSQLSFMGLPTPNIFTGGENFHGKYEFASLNVMEKATNTIIEIAKIFAERSE